MAVIRQHMQRVLTEAGLRLGTDLEDRVAYRFFRAGHTDFDQEYSVGKYRLDFAWPKHKVAVEADGWHHRSPEGAAKDAERDSWLRSEGWVILRIDDRHGLDSMERQISHTSRLIHIIVADGRLVS